MEKYFLPMLTLCMSSGYLHASTPKNRMNIVLIMADDFGYECIGANGGNYQTPHIDKLAEEGIRFEHCHSNPLSTPSRVQLMTGKYNVHNYVAFWKERQEHPCHNRQSRYGSPLKTARLHQYLP